MESITAPASGTIIARLLDLLLDVLSYPRRRRIVCPWDNLPLDLLLDVSSRLDAAADFVRFHAVCTAWRAAAPMLLSPAAACPVFSPELVGLWGGPVVIHTIVDIQSSISSCSHRVVPWRTKVADRNWVASADGTACWLFFPCSLQPSLRDHLTEAVTRLLPCFPDDLEIRMAMKKARGVVYADGTVFLYSFLITTFTAAILHPADTTWTVIKGNFEVPVGLYSDAGAVYHHGKVLYYVEDFWSVVTPSHEIQSRWSRGDKKGYYHQQHYIYIMESQGELLRASVQLDHDFFRDHTRVDITTALSVTVHVLEEGAGGAMRWRVKDPWSLADRILFLGSPASFAVDVHKVGISGGGCAYFVFGTRVFRYSFVVGKTELVKELPLGRWSYTWSRVWIWRQPTIAPIQQIREGLMLRPNKKQKISN